MKNKFYIYLFSTIIISLLFANSCSKNGTGPENEQKPRLTNQPEVLNIQQNTVDITWETDYISNSTIKYGTQSGNYTLTKTEDTKVKIHLITLRSLQANTTY